MKNKKGATFGGVIITVLILLAVMAILLLLYFIISGKGSGLFESIKDLFRFGGS